METGTETLYRTLVDNKASFTELMDCLKARSPNSGGPVRARRRPGSEQLRNGSTAIARIELSDASCTVFENGYALYDNSDRKAVIWVPDCLKKDLEYYYPELKEKKQEAEAPDPEPDEETEALWDAEEAADGMDHPGEETETPRDTAKAADGMNRLGREQLADMPWSIAVILAGENQIEEHLDRPMNTQYRSERNPEDPAPRNGYGGICGRRFLYPEEWVLYQEEKEERCAKLTGKQKEAYRLYFEEGYTQAEIAKMLGTSQRAICERLEGVRKKVRDYYEREKAA